MGDELRLSFTDDVKVENDGVGRVVISSTFSRLVLERPTPGVIDALTRLAGKGGSQGKIVKMAARDGFAAVIKFNHYLGAFKKNLLIQYTVVHDNTKLLTFVPSGHGFHLDYNVEAAREGRFIISRFAHQRRDGRDVVLSSPLCHAKVLIQHRVPNELLFLLSEPRSFHELSEALPNTPAEVTATLVAMLLDQRLITTHDTASDRPREDLDAALRQWEFHDLVFHARSRSGRHATPVGSTFRFAHHIDPIPLVKEVPEGPVYPLERPELDTDEDNFTRVLESRQSVHEHDAEHPISLAQLGAFLFRAARTKSVIDQEANGVPFQACKKNTPSGGGMHGLELYLTVGACEGLAPGMYYYDPHQHRLHEISKTNDDCQALLTYAKAATRFEPQVLISIAARFRRITWKYQSIAYALALKDTGALMQTMYLVATSMNLAPCAVGCGDSEVFARAAKLDYYEESTVGEFVLGSRARSS